MSTSDGGQSRRSARYAERTNHESREDSFNITSKAIALVFVAVVIATIFRYFQSREQTNAEISMVTQQIISDDTTRVWADITRSRPEEAAYCILVAYDYEKAEVGRREIALAPDGKESIRVSVDVPTNARAVAGGVYGCSSLVPPYLDTKNPQYNVES